MQNSMTSAERRPAKLDFRGYPGSWAGGYRPAAQHDRAPPVPMDVTASAAPQKRWNMMTEAEREAQRAERRRLRLCFRCGAPNHTAVNCPSARPRFTAIAAAGSPSF